jgi:hypothetical protein
MTNLPIKRIVLYKHGLGFFERHGSSGDGLTVQLSFKKDDMNDILKSLAAFPQGDGQVVNISYETPEEKKVALEKAPLMLGNKSALLDLVQCLRGNLIALHLRLPTAPTNQEATSPGQENTVRGYLIGVDQLAATAPNTLVSILLEDHENLGDSAVRTYPLADICGLDLLETQRGRDLRYVLELS